VLKRVLAGLILVVVTASGAAARPFANADASYVPGDFAVAPSASSRPKEAAAVLVLVAAEQGQGEEEYNLTVKFNGGEAAPKPVAELPPSGDLALSGDDRWVAVASAETVDEAIAIAQVYEQQKSRVVRARNGFFAVVLGPYPTSSISIFRKSYTGPDLPSKILLTRGTDYLATMWPATAEVPKPDPLAQSPAGTVAEPIEDPTSLPAQPKAVDETVVAAFAEQLENSAASPPSTEATDQVASATAGPVNDPDVAYDRGDYATALKLWKQNDPAQTAVTSEAPVAEGLPPENLALSGDDRWVAIASVEDAEAATVIARAFAEQKSRVVRARNGWFAVVLGPYPTTEISAFRKSYTGPDLPPGILLTRGTDYMATVWPAAGEAPEAARVTEAAAVDAAEPVAEAAAVDAAAPVAEAAAVDAAAPVTEAAAVDAAELVVASVAPPESGDTTALAPFRPIAELQPLAEKGDASAQDSLGTAYVKGDGVPQDYVLAHMWFNLAAALGSESARESRDAVAKVMTPDQIAEAQRLARQWKPVAAAQ
jgi:TPR repeat protein